MCAGGNLIMLALKHSLLNALWPGGRACGAIAFDGMLVPTTKGMQYKPFAVAAP